MFASMHVQVVVLGSRVSCVRMLQVQACMQSSWCGKCLKVRPLCSETCAVETCAANGAFFCAATRDLAGANTPVVAGAAVSEQGKGCLELDDDAEALGHCRVWWDQACACRGVHR